MLVVNAGSSSLKLSVLGPDDELLMDVDLPVSDPGSVGDVLEQATAARPRPRRRRAPGRPRGHRGHGRRSSSAPVTTTVSARLAELAPLHNPPAVAAIRALQALRPALPQVACFDTAFHATIPAEASTYAAARRLAGSRASPLRLPRPQPRLGQPGGPPSSWAAHRATCAWSPPTSGSGASLAAVAGGRSVDTTMGFTPLEGLVMATRSGSVDPGLLVWVLRHEQLSVDELEDALTRRAGLLGLSGVSDDLRRVFEAADDGDDRSRLALGVYVHRLRAAVAAMAAAMDGTDGLVFTGGAGEHSARLRRDACAGLGFLGVELDHDRNDRAGGDTPDSVVSRDSARTAVVVVHAREDLEIARQVRSLVAT